jgi:two-component system response regulator CpxR
MKTVLVVEDNEDIRDSLVDALELEGFKVVTACNGHEAFTYLQKSPQPDLMLLDVRMPVMSGPELLQAMKRAHVAEQMPVIIQSGEMNLNLPGVYPRLRKPYSMTDLLNTVRACQP